jgi:hypothetical protein
MDWNCLSCARVEFLVYFLRIETRLSLATDADLRTQQNQQEIIFLATTIINT